MRFIIFVYACIRTLYSALFETRSFPCGIWSKNSWFQINRSIVATMHRRARLMMGMAVAFWIMFCAVLITPLWAQPIADPTTCYAIPDQHDRLVRINRATAMIVQDIGPTGAFGADIETMSFKPGGAILYSIADRRQMGDHNSYLGTLDLTTGLFTPLGLPIGDGNGSAGLTRMENMDGMAYDPRENVIYAIHRRGGVVVNPNDLLIKINPTTGQIFKDAFGPGVDYQVVTGSNFTNVDDIAVDPVTGVLYGVSNNGSNGELIAIDKKTGAATVAAAFAQPDMEGLAFFNDGRLYAVTGDNGNLADSLFLIDRTLGTATLIGSFDQNGYDYDDYEAIDCLSAATAIGVKKSTNGVDADLPAGAVIVQPGAPVTWTYLIANTGSLTLTNITLVDNKIPTLDTSSCQWQNTQLGQAGVLIPFEAVTCTYVGIAQPGLYSNTATVVGIPITEAPSVSATDVSHYLGSLPAITIKKFTNQADADVAPGPYIRSGAPVAWTYVITNLGNVPLANVIVTDSQNLSVQCPQTTLPVTGQMICSATGSATPGQYENVGLVQAQPVNRAGQPVGNPVTANDLSHYFGAAPAIAIQKLTNGLDIAAPPGPILSIGDAVTWSYRVTNTGNVLLTAITVTDNRQAQVQCPQTALAPAAAMLCTATGIVTIGPYTNIGTATGQPIDPQGKLLGASVSATDASYYLGAAPDLVARKQDALQTDINGNAIADPGEIIGYLLLLTNRGSGAARSVTLNDVVDLHTLLVVGSVTTSQGSVTQGNQAGDTAVTAQVGDLAPGVTVTVTFQVVVENPLPGGVFKVANQGRFSGPNTPLVLTDDPDTAAPNDPTVTPVRAYPDLVSTKVDSVVIDADEIEGPSAGDTLHYRIVIINQGNSEAINLMVEDQPDPNTTLVVGSVQTNFGAILRGNNDGDTKVTIKIATLPAGGQLVITFRVLVHADLKNVFFVSNQAITSFVNPNVDSSEPPTILPSDDPDTLAAADPTITPIRFIPLGLDQAPEPEFLAQRMKLFLPVMQRR